MNGSEWDHARAEIQEHALDGFRQLKPATLRNSSETATFYWYPNGTNPVALVKVFTHHTAGNLYRQEFAAFHGLRATGRVCPVLCDSTRHHPEFWDESFGGPYFIAKPYFATTLDAALRTTTGLERLDIAAQELDIARLFLKLGWRDFDWRKENDVVAVDGKVLRVDLDCALALSAFFEKSTVGEEAFFSVAESAASNVVAK